MQKSVMTIIGRKKKKNRKIAPLEFEKRSNIRPFFPDLNYTPCKQQEHNVVVLI